MNAPRLNPDEINGVSVFVATHQVAVGILDVFLQSVAGGLIGQGPQTSALFVVFPAAGADAGVVISDLRGVLFCHNVGFHDVRVVASVFVAGSITADDDVLHVMLLTCCIDAPRSITDGLRTLHDCAKENPVRVLLIATNRHDRLMSRLNAKPLPIGLAYVAGAFANSRHTVQIAGSDVLRGRLRRRRAGGA